MKGDFFVTSVTTASFKTYPCDYVFRQKNRRYYGLTLILSGELELITEEDRLFLSEGTILLQRKNDKYQLRVTSEESSYIVLSYLAEPMETLLSYLPDRIVTTPRLRKYQDLFGEAVRLSHSLAPCAGARLCSAVQEILCCIIQEQNRKNTTPVQSHGKKAMLFMEQNFSLPISTSLIAAEVGISPSHLRAVFQKEYGTSPIKALNDIRIRHAKSMIRSGNFTLQEVAAQCGFANEYYFGRVFKQLTGSSPGKY